MDTRVVVVAGVTSAIVTYLLLALAIRRDLPGLVIPRVNGIDNPR